MPENTAHIARDDGRIISSMLSREHTSKWEHLPNLIPETNSIESLWKEFTTWLKSLLPQGNIAADYAFLVPLVKIFFMVAFVISVLFLVVLLIRSVIEWFRRPDSTQGATLVAAAIPKKSGLDDRLKALLAENKYAEAARLRWLLFLSRVEEPSSSTPKEFTERLPWKTEIAPHLEVSEFDALMFGDPFKPELVFRKVEEILERIENLRASDAT
jgi:hypothetical protein